MTTSLETGGRRRGPTAQAVFGLMVIVVGVLFTLDNLDIIDARDYLQYWPAGLVVVGLLKLWQAARDGRGWFGGLFFVVLGTWMLIERIVYFTINARELMPLMLVFLGGYMVWRGFGGQRRERGSTDGHSSFSGLAIMGGVEDKTRVPQPASSKRLVIRGLVVMGGVTVKNGSVREEREDR